MCGIWSFVRFRSKRSVVSLFQDFQQLQHRGPDHTRFESYGNVMFGFHRLAIVDTHVHSNQPFIKQNAQRTVYFLCNGEIYNYKELIQEYQLDPAIVKNDCQVLLEIYWKFSSMGQYNEWYLFLREKVKGEFAFVLFEFDALQQLRHVIASRDSIGIRPLYVSVQEDVNEHGLLFTSELKGALQYPGRMEEFTPGYTVAYHISPLGEITMDRRQTMAFSLSSPFATSTNNTSILDLFFKITGKMMLKRVRDATMASVQRRLSADRPIAFLTSGGIDSSLVSALSAKLLGKPIRTFCCGLSEGGVAVGRDMEYAREVAQWIGSEHTEVLFTKEEALAAIPDVVRTVESWDTTTVRASVGQYLVCRWIGQNTDCRVVMVGEGPDEVCSSYLFNWYAPTPEALDRSAREYVQRIHLYDSRRADRCIARWGLEARVPFLDPEFIAAYWALPAVDRMPKTHGIEKWCLREAFRDTDVLPERVRMRMKDAFSDSISGQVSWTQIIQEWVSSLVTDEEMAGAAERFPFHTPQTKEAYYYRTLFCQSVGENRQEVLSGYWQPRWNADGQEISGYVDPSARTLGVYQTRVTQ